MTTNTTTIVLTADDTTAAALIATIKASVNGERKYADYVTAHNVTRENVKHHAVALAALVYPNDEAVQTTTFNGVKTRTRYGNAVQMAGAGLRRALGKSDSDTPETDWIKKILADCDKAIDNGTDAGAVADAVQTWVASVLS